jgi:hypothetical protein
LRGGRGGPQAEVVPAAAPPASPRAALPQPLLPRALVVYDAPPPLALVVQAVPKVQVVAWLLLLQPLHQHLLAMGEGTRGGWRRRQWQGEQQGKARLCMWMEGPACKLQCGSKRVARAQSVANASRTLQPMRRLADRPPAAAAPHPNSPARAALELAVHGGCPHARQARQQQQGRGAGHFGRGRLRGRGMHWGA